VDEKILITVFTATYNRAGTLQRVFDSLQRQEFRDFEWLIVDDGSTDDTESRLESFRREAEFPIVYHRTANGGKHRALNLGARLAAGEAFFVVDSDDALPVGALAALARAWPEAASDEAACGIIGYKARFEGGLLTGPFPEGVRCATSVEIRYRYGVRGDKAEVLKTAVLRENPFPEIEGERFVTEDLVFNRIAKTRHFILLPEIIYLAEYLPDGLSAKSLELRVANPRGSVLYYRELLALDVPYLVRLRAGANLTRILLHCRTIARHALAGDGGWSRPSVPAGALGGLLYCMDKARGRGRPAL
jgi:glycosyltransferase involved in cell wall biosynthesis